jgi:hypothetical protein
MSDTAESTWEKLEYIAGSMGIHIVWREDIGRWEVKLGDGQGFIDTDLAKIIAKIRGLMG